MIFHQDRLAIQENRPENHAPKKLSLIHISEPTRQAEISYAVFCLKKKKKKKDVSYTHLRPIKH